MLKVTTVLLGLTAVISQLNFNAGKKACQPIPPFFRSWGLTTVQVPEAWVLRKHHSKVKVAVIDTGIDPKHPDLAGRVSGYDFSKNEVMVADSHGHGTHVAGIIGAATNVLRGSSGITEDVSFVGVRYYSDTASGQVNLRNTVLAIDYAIQQGVRIINYSGGGPEFSEDEYLAIRRAEDAGILFVAAAGNEGKDSDRIENYYYPSAYRLSNIISVASTDLDDVLLASSNWGKAKVDLAAPGLNVFSTLPNGKYGVMTGTSQATAFVTGVAAMLLSEQPNLDVKTLKQLILGSVDKRDSLKDRVATEGVLNACGAMKALQSGSHKTQFPKKTK